MSNYFNSVVLSILLGQLFAKRKFEKWMASVLLPRIYHLEDFLNQKTIHSQFQENKTGYSKM